MSAGTHTLKNVVDESNNIQETNEGNNIKTQSLAVNHLKHYDLVPKDFTVTPTNPGNADSITIRYTEQNLGPDDITTPFNMRLYIGNSQYHQCDFPSGAQAGILYYCERTGITLTPGTYKLKIV